MSNSRFHTLTVDSVVDETQDARSLVFRIPAEITEQFSYKPGQFLTLRLPWQGGQILRCYSMSSTPDSDPMPRVTVKRVDGGRGSNWICDQVQPGDTMEVMKPAGVFVPASYAGDFLLFAGGSGVTPVYSILRSVLKHGTGRIRMLYANRDEASIIFKNELKALMAEYPERLEVIHLLDSVQGIPSVALLARLSEQMQHAQAFICGPGPYMDAAEAALAEVGMDPDHVHVERFISLPDENEREAAQDVSDHEAVVSQAQVAIDLYGTEHQINCKGDETLLKAAERQGVELPYSCEVGMCASCMCEVTEGEVDLLHNEVLDERDLKNRMTLTCQSVPTTANLKLRFS